MKLKIKILMIRLLLYVAFTFQYLIRKYHIILTENLRVISIVYKTWHAMRTTGLLR
jgi:hypothetical protein